MISVLSKTACRCAAILAVSTVCGPSYGVALAQDAEGAHATHAPAPASKEPPAPQQVQGGEVPEAEEPAAPEVPVSTVADTVEKPVELPNVTIEQEPEAAAKPVLARAKPKRVPVTAGTQVTSSTAPAKVQQSEVPPPVEAAAGVPAAQAAQSRPAISTPMTATSFTPRDVETAQSRTSDTASMLSSVAGVSIAQGGGVSGLPVLNGLADDRVKVIVNGREATSACGNHMNPPLSYADPGQVKRIKVMPGATPVSEGGDSIAGTIVVDTLPPAFAGPAGEPVAHASLSSVYRSNGDGISTSASAHAAAGNVSMGYTGAFTRASNYHDGGGTVIGSSEYEAHNHALALAARDGSDVYVLEAGVQHIPYQGFVNQPMDMVINDSFNVSGRYEGALDWGRLTIATSYQHVRHGMNFLEDKLLSFEAAGWGANSTMPMNTLGDEGGYKVKAEIPLLDGNTLRVGNELHLQRLDDRWPAVCFTSYCGMGPDTYVNINGGSRDRFGTFVEWERVWSPAWSTLIGVRNDVVRMNTGDVQPYERLDGDVDTAAAQAFNTASRGRTDVNFDATALVRHEASRETALELALSRKTRSPNLYERYAWGQSTMTSQMTTWFGDANGYIGNLDLEPEVAHRLSFTAGIHDAAREKFEFKVTPFYTRVQDFITAERVAEVGWVSGFNQLRFVNHDATLYGIDMAARAWLLEGDWGRLSLTAIASYVRGEDRETGGPLYHMMPWNGRVALEHKQGNLTTVAELEMVAAKTRIDIERLEPATAGYALLNLRTSYQMDDVRFDIGVDNVFDTLYFAPLGGTNYTDYLLPGHAVAGAGRSVFAGVTVNF